MSEGCQKVMRRMRQERVPLKYRQPPMRDGVLDIYYGFADGDGPDVCVKSGHGAGGSPNRHMVLDIFCGEHYDWDGKKRTSAIEELDARGFDISTLKFSIKMKGA